MGLGFSSSLKRAQSGGASGTGFLNSLKFSGNLRGANNDFASLLPKASNALNLMRSGVRNMVIGCVGDSNTAGFFATGANYAGNRPFSYPNLLGELLRSKFTVYDGNQVGDGTNQATFANFTAYDSRFTFPSGGWQLGTTLQFGGRSLIGSNGASASANFTPGSDKPFDTIEIMTTLTPGAGGLSLSVDGGAVLGSTIVNAGTLAVQKVIRTCPLGVHTVNINRVGTTATIINSIRTYNSQVKGIEILTIGAGSSTPLQWSANTAKNDPSYIGADGFFGVTAPDLVIINNAKNAWGTGVTTANYKTQTTAIILAAQQTADVILTSSTPQNNTVNAQANQDAMNQAVKELAASMGLIYIDVNLAFNRSWDYGFSQNWYPSLAVDATGNHPLTAGYAVNAHTIFDALIAIGL